MFDEMGLLRSHIKRQHLNKIWSLRHKYIRANITNIEILEEMSQFAELKTLTENAMKEMIAAHGGQQNGRAQFSERWKPARTRGASQNDVPRKQQRAGEAEAKGDAKDVDVMDLITPVHLQLSAQLGSRVRDLEAATYCTLFLPNESDIVTEMQNAGRFYSDMVTRHPDKERGSPHIWFFNAMLRATKKILTNRNKNGELSLPD